MGTRGVVNGLRDGAFSDEVDEWGAAGEDSGRVHFDGFFQEEILIKRRVFLRCGRRRRGRVTGGLER